MWSAINAVVSVAGPFVTFIFAARALDPVEFGIIGFTVAMVELLKCFAPQGLYEVLLSGDTEAAAERAVLSTLILSSLGLIAVFELALYFSQSLHAEIGFYFLPLSLLGLRSVFDLAALQPQATLARRLDFARLSLRSILANGAAVAVGLAVIFAGAAFWGLILYYLTLSVVSFLTVAVGTGAMRRPSLDFSGLRGLRREGFFASLVRLLGAVNNYFDQTLVALLVPAAALGNFAFGKRFEMALVTGGMSFSGILFQPSFANSTAAEREVLYTRGLALLTFLFAFPVLVFVVLAPEAVRLVFGERWVEAAPVGGFLAMSGLFRILGSLFGAQLSATRRNRDLLGVSAFSAGVGIATVIAFGPLGVLPLSMALAAKNGVTLVLFAWVATRNRLAMALRLARILVLPAFVGLGAAALFDAGLSGRLPGGPLIVTVAEAVAIVVVATLALVAANWREARALAARLPRPAREGQ
jgi:PST family polysaccharide transporter